MDRQSRNQKSLEYYYKTKDSLTEEVKIKRRQQAKIRSLRFYENNKELCRLRVSLCREKNPVKKQFIQEMINNLNRKISKSDIEFLKSFDLSKIMTDNPKLKIWDKEIANWNILDLRKFKKLING